MNSKIKHSRPLPAMDRGFTLIEIIMVLLVFGMMYVAVPRLDLIGTDVRTKLSQLRSDFRSAYDLAVINNKPYRLVFHLISGDYWLEEADSPQILLNDEDLDNDPFGDEAEDLEQDYEDFFEKFVDIVGKERIDEESTEETPVQSPFIEAKERLKNIRAPRWTPVENAEWSKRSLGPDLIIKGMQALHHSSYQSLEDLGEQGRAAIYVLPPGYIEPAYMHIAYNNGNNEVDEKQKPYTLIVDSYAGIVDVQNDEQEVDLKNPDKNSY